MTLIIFISQVLTFIDTFQFQNFSRSQYLVEKIIAQLESILKYIVCLYCHSLYLPAELHLKTSEHTKCFVCQKVLTKAIRGSGGKHKYKVKFFFDVLYIN